jgi:DNA-binding HxlR family transcriptional regulator
MRIISELGEEDLMFTELIQRLGVSKGTLSSHLTKLSSEGKIKKQYSPKKNAIVYSVLPETVLREVIIHDFVNFIGVSVVYQILQKEMGEIKEIDMRKAFTDGTVEDFFQKRYKRKPLSYRLILDILKEEYGDWIEKEDVGSDPF